MRKEKKIKIGISIGDLNGIGGELIVRTFSDNRLLEFCTPVVFASTKIMSFLKKHFQSSISIHGINDASHAVDGKLNVVNVWKHDVNIDFGKETLEAGQHALESLKAAVASIKANEVDVLVTAPINKHNIQSEDFKFPGHTDFLNQELEGDSLMFMVSNTLRVGLLTDHVPVGDVPQHLNETLILKKINLIHHSLEQDFALRAPKIAVLGVNPHTGDSGVIGSEDDTILRPALEKIKASGKLIYGPYAADSFFGSNNYQNFDAIVATYHDQGLIPFKTLTFGNGVNYTAGLCKVRTSPDHGTAYDIAGKGIANIDSFKEAIFVGIEIYRNRTMDAELKQNPLRKQVKTRK
ncbi:4-hydroxythreonine-4-phosphate dehydrogenase PdxA [Flavobacteriaceae bacterium]|jgi:4-hydroxythreonine-4-phosphate dehydrogenase|nr:4-hydroxythreonine-4-phosphate dehydrogenase PdxA [Flavobacteriaceae bacterium]